mgnify:CR=1 FL=1
MCQVGWRKEMTSNYLSKLALHQYNYDQILMITGFPYRRSVVSDKFTRVEAR